MRLTLHFENRSAVLIATPETDEERLMLGVIAATDTGEVEGEVDFEHEGHFTHRRAKVVRVRVRAKKEVSEGQKT